MKHLLFSLSIFGIFTLISCQDATDIVPIIDCKFDSVEVPEAETDSIARYLSSQGVSASKDERGFYYIVEEAGNEDRIENCFDISVDYKVYLFDGAYVDQGEGVKLRASRVIRGFAFGLTHIGKEGKITLFLPPSLAYGEKGSYPAIGSDEYLIYEITLHSMIKNNSPY